MTEEPLPQNEWLIPFQNPLKSRFDRAFFSGLPRIPGIYMMLGEDDEVLYVGKAKDLRARIASYRHLKPDTTSRKTIRMLNQVREIRIEKYATEKEALLRENSLLRELQPPYNILNTRPENYYFIGFSVTNGEKERKIHFTLTKDPMRQEEFVFGAFKSRRMIREGYSALLRLLWVSQSNQERFSYPARLCRERPAYEYSVEFPEHFTRKLLRSFLEGRSTRFIEVLTAQLLENESIPKFVYRTIQDDLELLKEFYKRGPRRNRTLKKHHCVSGLRTRLIAQEELDDLLVMELARLGKIK